MWRAVIAALAVLIVHGALAPRSSLAEDGMLPSDRLGIRTAPLLLLSRPDVRAELRLDDAQTSAAERAVADLHAKAAALRGKSGPEAIEARRSIDQAQVFWIDRILSPEQRRRLVQLDLQWEGPSALISRAVVADHLRLSTAQRAALRQAVDAYQKKRSAGPYRPEEASQLHLQTMAILLPDQKDRWLAMLGDRFNPMPTVIAQDPTRPRVDPGLKRTAHAQP